ncbi:DUF6531 domain-containing protein [Paraburkholderia sediminicola]|uniref:DUF6531 domain-containing protein n=1 Tax=Paraburkholderia sediminicola TaxID=458836 RepID=UPI0038B84D55
MKSNKITEGPAGVVARLLVAFMLLVVAFGANAADCNAVWAATGAKPGSPTCRWDAYAGVPGGMQYYNCVSLPLIDAWCATPPADQPEASCPVADPVLPGNGTVTLTEADFVSGDDIPMQFTRTYRSKSLGTTATGMGPVWFHNWQRNLGLTNANSGSASKVFAYRGNGDPITFNWSAGTWRSAGGSGLALSQSGSGWTLVDLKTDTVESYSTQGVLLSESTKTGFVRTLTYDGSGLLTTITQHAAGTDANKDVTLRLDYDDKRRLSRVNDPLGRMTQYGYDANGNLISVTWPDGYAHRYVYDDARFKNALTGEIDEVGNRIATWSYDAQGRATTASHPDSSRNAQFNYGPGSTSVTDNKRTTTLNFSSVGGMLRPTSSSSADGATSLTWDASGNLLKDTGASGNTEYGYDDVGRPVRITVNSASGASITTIRYADATSLHPLIVASPGVIQSFVYDAQGNTTGMSETPTTDSTGASGFEAAKSDGTTRAYGMVYDAFNRLTFVQMYEREALVGQWKVARDSTGNVYAIVLQQQFPQATEMASRDAVHRVEFGFNPTGDFNLHYDRRGRIDNFKFNEYASPVNGGVRRVFKVKFGYSPNGEVVSRTGTVAKNGSILDMGDGTDVPISSHEIDEWIDNYNFGEAPVGPPANLQGASRLLGDNFLGTSTVCSGCHFSAGLPDGILRSIVFVWRLVQYPAVRYGIGQGARKAAETIERIKEQCKPVVKDTSEINFGRNENQLNHTFRHLDEEGIAHQPVIDAIRQDLAETSGAKLAVGDGESFYVTVNGRLIEYSSNRLSPTEIRVGSIRPQKP